MSLDEDAVRRIALLARMEITAEERVVMRDQLNGILSMIGQLQSVDTRDVVPMAHAQDVSARLREDAVLESDQHALFQSVAPKVEQGLYLVPRVIE
jgi:aspartyl-tRNA(Asn)/glutamyl-tRNA(Gln) amidotransferase subunit C